MVRAATKAATRTRCVRWVMRAQPEILLLFVSMTRGWIFVGLAVACGVGALFWAWTRLSEYPPAWRAEYFDSVELHGRPIASARYTAIDFAWGTGAPSPLLAIDAFSARLDSCLDLREPVRVTFHLASDDGARLSVNGTALIDNWGIHAWGMKSGNTILPQGRHHLRIDYFEGGGDAALYLAANPPILDAGHLVPPEEPFRPSLPCGSGR